VSDDRLYLIHIRECCSKILANAVESAKRVTDDLKQAHPENPWRRVIGIRNVLVHDYLGVDLGRIWESKVQSILTAKPSTDISPPRD